MDVFSDETLEFESIKDRTQGPRFISVSSGMYFNSCCQYVTLLNPSAQRSTITKFTIARYVMSERDRICDIDRSLVSLPTAEYHWVPGATDIDVDGAKDSDDSNDADILPDVVHKGV